MTRNLKLDSDSDHLLTEVKSVIIEAVNLRHVDPKTILPTTTLGPNGLNLDSIDILEIVVAVEKHFNVKVENSTKGKEYFSSIGNIAKFVSEYSSGS